MVGVQQSMQTWLATFDDLTGLPKARLAVFVYVLLSVLAALAGLVVAIPIHDLVVTYLPILETKLSTTRFGISFNADIGGLILTALVILVWLQAMRVVRKLAFWVGGTAQEMPQ